MKGIASIKCKCDTVCPLVLAFLFAIAMIIGRAYDSGTAISRLFATPGEAALFFLGCFAVCFFVLRGSVYVLSVLSNVHFEECKPYLFFKQHLRPVAHIFSSFVLRYPFIFAFVLLQILWLPVFVGYLPGLFMGDTPDQIFMAYNIPNRRSNMVTLIDDTVTLTGHHPLLHTYLLSFFVHAGDNLFGDVNIGVALYTIFQFNVFIASIAYAFSTIVQVTHKAASSVLALVFVAFVPMFPVFSALVTKDTLFSAALLITIVQLSKLIIVGELNTRDKIVLCLAAFFAAFLRNGAVFYIALPLILLAAISKRSRRLIIGLALGILTIQLALSCLIMPALHITKGSRVEMLSVPIQQVARYVYALPHEVTEQEKIAISAVLPYDELPELYNPRLSDPIKDKVLKDASLEDFKTFLGTWFNMGLKQPLCYLSAFLKNKYDFFYISKDAGFFYSMANSNIYMSVANEEGFSFHHVENEFYSEFAAASEGCLYGLSAMPLMRLFVCSPLYVWVLITLFVWSICRNEWFRVILLLPLLLILLVSLMGPTGGTYIRYMFPVALCLPFMFVLFPMLKKENI